MHPRDHARISNLAVALPVGMTSPKPAWAFNVGVYRRWFFATLGEQSGDVLRIPLTWQ
jgi:hypothetical protein